MIYKKALVGLSVVVFLMVLIASFYINKSISLEGKLKITKLELSVEKANNVGLKSALDELNKKIEANALEYEKNIEEYNQMIEGLKPTEVKSNECEDIKSMLDIIRNTGY